MVKKLSVSVFLICIGFANLVFGDITNPTAGTNYGKTTGISVLIGGDPDFAGLAAVIEVLKKDSNGEFTIVISTAAISALNEFGAASATLYPPMQGWPVGTGTVKIVAKVQGHPGVIDYGEVVVNIVN